MRAHTGVYYAAATTIIVAGLIQLVLASTLTALQKGNPSLQIFFTGIGVLQLFWAVGIIRKWGSAFYSLATGLNIALIFLWLLLRLPQNIIGIALPTNALNVALEALQIIFFGLCTIILASNENRKLIAPSSKTNIMNSIIIAGKVTSMASRTVVLGIGAAILIIGLAGIISTMQQVVQQYQIKSTSTPPYTSEPPVQPSSSVYVEIVFIIAFIAGLTVMAFGATFPMRVSRPQIGR